MNYEWNGARGSVHEGVFFTEERFGGQHLGRVDVDIALQNADLDQVKSKMALRARALGANAIGDFRYGQRRHSVRRYLNPLRWDTESWYGEGEAWRV